MDGCMFLSFNLLVAIHCHLKLERARIFLNITPIEFVLKKVRYT